MPSLDRMPGCFSSSGYVLNLSQRIIYGLGHILNELTAAMWLTYLLVFMHYVIGFSNDVAGYLMLIGQVTDAVATPVLGFAMDRTRGLCGYSNRKSWHLVGAIAVVLSFPFVFMPCLLGDIVGTWGKFGYYVVFTSVFQLGYLSIQIAHLSLIPALSPNKVERTELNAIRYAFTVIATILLYLITWLMLGMNEHSHVIEHEVSQEDIPVFRSLALAVVGIGFLFVIVFHLVVKEPERAMSLTTDVESGEQEDKRDTVDTHAISARGKSHQEGQITVLPNCRRERTGNQDSPIQRYSASCPTLLSMSPVERSQLCLIGDQDRILEWFQRNDERLSCGSDFMKDFDDDHLFHSVDGRACCYQGLTPNRPFVLWEIARQLLVERGIVTHRELQPRRTSSLGDLVEAGHIYNLPRHIKDVRPIQQAEYDHAKSRQTPDADGCPGTQCDSSAEITDVDKDDRPASADRYHSSDITIESISERIGPHHGSHEIPSMLEHLDVVSDPPTIYVTDVENNLSPDTVYLTDGESMKDGPWLRRHSTDGSEKDSVNHDDIECAIVTDMGEEGYRELLDDIVRVDERIQTIKSGYGQPEHTADPPAGSEIVHEALPATEINLKLESPLGCSDDGKEGLGQPKQTIYPPPEPELFNGFTLPLENPQGFCDDGNEGDQEHPLRQPEETTDPSAELQVVPGTVSPSEINLGLATADDCDDCVGDTQRATAENAESDLIAYTESAGSVEDIDTGVANEYMDQINSINISENVVASSGENVNGSSSDTTAQGGEKLGQMDYGNNRPFSEETDTDSPEIEAYQMVRPGSDLYFKDRRTNEQYATKTSQDQTERNDEMGDESKHRVLETKTGDTVEVLGLPGSGEGNCYGGDSIKLGEFAEKDSSGSNNLVKVQHTDEDILVVDEESEGRIVPAPKYEDALLHSSRPGSDDDECRGVEIGDDFTTVIWRDTETNQILSVKCTEGSPRQAADGQSERICVVDSTEEIKDDPCTIERDTITHEPTHIPWKEWFKHLQFYQIAVVYMCARLVVNISQVYLPFYLSDSIMMDKQFIAIIPLILYTSGFVAALIARPINVYCGGKVVYFGAGLVTLAACVWIRMLHHNHEMLVFGAACLLGLGGPTLLVTSLSLITELIGHRSDSGSFVFGSMTFAEKLVTGITIFVIQENHPCPTDVCCKACVSYYRDILTFVPGVMTMIGLFTLLTLAPAIIGELRLHQNETPRTPNRRMKKDLL